jgi:hypothetical protein
MLVKLYTALENKFDLLASQFAKFCARFDEDAPLKKKTSGKGKGRGKKSKPQESESDPGVLSSASLSEADINAEAQRRLELFLKETELPSTSKPNLRQNPPRSFRSVGASSINNDLMTDDLSSYEADSKVVYIKKIECKLNQTLLDQVEDNQRNE